jgi:hypothetical protein
LKRSLRQFGSALERNTTASQARKAEKLAQAGAESFEVIAREWHAKFSPGWVARVKTTSIYAEELYGQAADLAGEPAFGFDPFSENLERLLDSLAADGALTPRGADMTRAEFTGYLRNRLELQRWLRELPQIAEQPIERPVFCLGLPRSGTTFLLNLFDHDERLRLLRAWEVRAPVPPPALDPASVTRRIASARRSLGQWKTDVADFDALHLLDVEGPDECTMLMSAAFAQAGFHNYLNVPGWFEWMADALDFEAAYCLHRQQLQALQWASAPRRWALKYPNHVLAVDAIRRVYPDASFVFTHRDPDVTLASLCSLTYEFRAPRTAHNERAVVGRQMTAFVLKHVQRIIDFRNSPAARQCAVVDIDYYRLVDQPVAVLDEVYRALGMQMSEGVERRLSQWTADNPKGKRGVHQYSAQEFGLQPELTEHVFSAYRERFGLRRERPAA